jgi:hypothetical protein
VLEFEDHDGANRITDFAHRVDRIDVSDYEFASAAAVLARGSQAGDDVLFDFGGGTSVRVEDTSLHDFGAWDFIV